MGTRESTMRMYPPATRFGAFFDTIGPLLHAVLRIGVALLFMQHGVQKLFGWIGGVGGGGETAQLGSLLGVAGVLEFFGGILLLIGLLTRPVALILVGEMLVAYVMVHLPQNLVPILNQGELALLYALSFAFLFGNGAGPFSLDHAIARGKERARRAERQAGESQTGMPEGARTSAPAPTYTRDEIAVERKEHRRDSAA